MKKKTILAAAVCLTAMLFAGCGAKEPQTVVFTLPSNPTTGFTWEVTQTNAIFDIQKEDAQEETDEQLLGAGGTEVYVLTPKEAGETRVTVEYKRDWEGGEVDTSVNYDFEVSKSLQIKLTGATGELSGDTDSMDNPPEMEIR